MGSIAQPTEDWESIAKAKQADAYAQIPEAWRLSSDISSKISSTNPINVLDIPRTCGILSKLEIEITEQFTATELVRHIASRRYTAVEVTKAFSKRAAIAQQLTKCLTETFFDKALERAKFLDEYLAQQGKPIGPLHGLPISIKDGFNVQGIPSTLGYISFLKRPLPEKNSPLVDILLSLGAVLYVKTNIPQTLLTADSDNNLFGRTLNPHKLTLTPGGSSGGEGALVALRGSLIGVGTDIGGSVRIPALCCGTYGLKGCVGRIPFGDLTSASRAGAPGVLASAGPLTTAVEDIRLFLSSVLSTESQPWNIDSTALCAPWRRVAANPKPLLHLGFILESESQPISSPVARTLKTAVQRLQAGGHKVIMLKDFPDIEVAGKLTWRLLSADPRKTALRHIEDGNEPQVSSVESSLKKIANLPRGTEPLEMDEFYDLSATRARLKQAWNDIFVANRLDAIMLAGNITPAPPHDEYHTGSYTGLANLLDYPASIIPFLKADKDIDLADARVPYYDPEAEHGAPCAIQLMTRSQQEEELTAVTEVVAKVLEHGEAGARL